MLRDAAADRPAIADILAAAWLTRDLDSEVRDQLASLGRLERVDGGTVLVREAEASLRLGVVVSGRLGLRMRVPERGQVTILTVEAGDIVGWSAIVPPFRSTSTVVAIVPSELVLFDGEDLRRELQKSPILAASFYPLVLAAVARRLDGTRLQLLDLFTQRWVEPW